MGMVGRVVPVGDGGGVRRGSSWVTRAVRGLVGMLRVGGGSPAQFPAPPRATVGAEGCRVTVGLWSPAQFLAPLTGHCPPVQFLAPLTGHGPLGVDALRVGAGSLAQHAVDTTAVGGRPAGRDGRAQRDRDFEGGRGGQVAGPGGKVSGVPTKGLIRAVALVVGGGWGLASPG
jgi:hypothetical protein